MAGVLSVPARRTNAFGVEQLICCQYLRCGVDSGYDDPQLIHIKVIEDPVIANTPAPNHLAAGV
jgi:hypothetical protein